MTARTAEAALRRPTSGRQADLERAIRAASAAGLTVAEIVIEGKATRLKLLAQTQAAPDTVQPKEWPAG